MNWYDFFKDFATPIILGIMGLCIAWKQHRQNLTETIRQNKQNLREITLQYLEMENANLKLAKAYEWIDEQVMNPNAIILEKYADKEIFFQYFKIPYTKNGTTLSLPKTTGVHELLKQFKLGREYIEEILFTYQLAAEAMNDGIIDKELYLLIRRGQFNKYGSILKEFIKEKEKVSNNPNYLEAYRSHLDKESKC